MAGVFYGLKINKRQKSGKNDRKSSPHPKSKTTALVGEPLEKGDFLTVTPDSPGREIMAADGVGIIQSPDHSTWGILVSRGMENGISAASLDDFSSIMHSPGQIS